MKDKHNEEIKENYDNNKFSQNESNSEFHTNRLLNTLLSIIVIITVVTGSIIYYSLYKYSKEDDKTNIPVENNQQQVDEDVSTVADIIDTALNTNTTEENVSPEETTTIPETTQSQIRKYNYSYYSRS